MSPKFSIIIPVYNVAAYLRECLDSVLAQTFTEWEAICVDDGSTDGSGAILDEYGAKDKRFLIIHQENSGVSVARNNALDVANGEWIGFVDADDKLLPRRLANIAETIDQNEGVEVIRTGWTNWRGSKRVPRAQCGDAAVRFARGEQSTVGLWSLVSQCSFPFILYYKKEIGNRLRYVKGVRFREDALFQYSVAQEGLEVVVIPEDGYLHREREGSATLQVRRCDDSYRLLQEYLVIWAKMPTRCIRRKCKVASTAWISKDIAEWYRLCPMRCFRDSFLVWISVWRLLLNGAFAPFQGGSIFFGLRRFLYLLTGHGRFCFLTRLSMKTGGRNG